MINGMEAWCVDAMIQKQDLMDARQRIKRNRNDG